MKYIFYYAHFGGILCLLVKQKYLSQSYKFHKRFVIYGIIILELIGLVHENI